MVVIGLTGGVGTGKTSVSKMFKALGAVVIDADELAHELIRPHRAAWRAILKTFGTTVLKPDLTLDRRHLAKIVFRDPRRRLQLEGMLHPPILSLMRQRVRRLRRTRQVAAVVLEIPLLFEAGARSLVDVVVVVTATSRVQRERLKRIRGWSDREIRARTWAQWKLAAKAALADDVIDNSGTISATRTQVRRIWNRRVVQGNW